MDSFFGELDSFDGVVDESDDVLVDVDSDEEPLEDQFESEDGDEADDFEPEPLRLSFL